LATNQDNQRELEIYGDAGLLARAAAGHFMILAGQATAERGRFAVALSGGSTPRATYALLASDEFARRIDWGRVHVFWGDERCVPPDHSDSNYRMARESLLDHAPLPPENVHRIRGELEPGQAAREYEGELRRFFYPGETAAALPRFDLVLLGLGDDGHTVSLFPGSTAMHEPDRWAVADYVEKLEAWRVTLTPVLINAARRVAFIVSGAGKAEVLREVLAGPYRPDRLPAQTVRPRRGRLLWLADAAAAASLEGG
jgi:6-phosphogluconolactonase